MHGQCVIIVLKVNFIDQEDLQTAGPITGNNEVEVAIKGDNVCLKMPDRAHLVAEMLLCEVAFCVHVAGEGLLPVLRPILVEEFKVVCCKVAVHEIAVTHPVKSFLVLPE